MTVVLGYNGGIDGYPSRFGASHNSAACLLVDGEVVAACEEERFSREKHSGSFPRLAVRWCLEQAGLRSVADVDLVTYYYSYPLMFRPEVLHQNRQGLNVIEQAALWTVLTGMSAFNRVAGYTDKRSATAFERHMGVPLRAGQYHVVPHHVCHTASAFYDSPFERALCLTLDAQGESNCSMVSRCSGTDLKVLHETFIPNSLGYLYTFVTTLLGFDWHDEYKVMGLAPYGNRAAYRDFFRSIIQLHPDGTYQIDQGLMLQLIATQANDPADRTFPFQVVEGLGSPRPPSQPVLQRHMDIAASLQEALEETVLHQLTALKKQTGETQLCMAGGVALNSTMNGRIAASGLFDQVWVHTASHDAGTCVGAAMYGYHNVLGKPRHFQKHTHRYWGPGFAAQGVEEALAAYGDKVTHQRPENLVETVAQALADGKVVGWYQGRMEWGPRALGNRSILADARREDMKDVVNHAVKLREGFRPFAPAVLDEQAREWFDLTGLPDSPYMLFVVPVLPHRRAAIPAVTHVDGSARVQTVSAQDNPRFHALIEAFHRRTGVPVVMNTSFNVKGEPIVNTPADAVRCFLGTQIDMLVVDDVLVEKRPEVAAALQQERGVARRSGSGRVEHGQISAL